MEHICRLGRDFPKGNPLCVRYENFFNTYRKSVRQCENFFLNVLGRYLFARESHENRRLLQDFFGIKDALKKLKEAAMKNIKIYLYSVGLTLIFFLTAAFSFARDGLRKIEPVSQVDFNRALVEWEPAAIMLFGLMLVILAGICRKRVIRA